MSKKSNTLLFILGGTVFNILVTVLSFLLFWVLCSIFIIPRLPPDSTAWTWVITAVFIAAIVVSFLIYRLTIKILMKKIDFEKYFDPIVGPRRPPRKD